MVQVMDALSNRSRMHVAQTTLKDRASLLDAFEKFSEFYAPDEA